MKNVEIKFLLIYLEFNEYALSVWICLQYQASAN